MYKSLQNYVFLLATIAIVLSYASVSHGKVVLIGLAEQKTSVLIGGTASFTVSDNTKDHKEVFPPGKQYSALPVKNGITVNNISFGKKITVISDEKGLITFNGRRYRGALIIKNDDKDSLTVINEIDVDQYVRGILKHEISHTWPEEALKTQAVISRTYALKNTNRHKTDGYNLCANAHCQVYGGVEAEDPRIDRAVEKTRNMVVTYEGNLAQTVFFSTCGGYTENAAHVWKLKTAPYYLQGKRCPYCKGTPRYAWEEFVSHAHINKSLLAHGIKKPVTMITIAKRYASGRAREILVKHGGGKTLFTANDFRLFVGPGLVRSAMITQIKKNKKGFVFTGRGSGHGVGLCQWGMKQMADKGYSFKKILQFYYPKTKIKTLH